MRTSSLVLYILTTAASLQAARLDPYLGLKALSPIPFNKRQANTVPSQCTTTCDPVNSEVSAGCPITACCSQDFETAYYNCLTCVGTADDATNYTTAQQDLDLLYVTCYDSGYTSLQKYTLPGQNPNRTLSTTNAGPSATAPPASSASAAQTLTSSFTTSISTTSTSPSTSPSSAAMILSSNHVWVGFALILGIMGTSI
ncbi:hypothetical protein BJ138DRAFT_1004450 [Hygrophoropsis aurantiaca]|uniref:Uncharacterized protein n=1 Tax=Hygrophoropsis aurantiaca TaxID=72124 RepID=A0ACB8AGT1_9AGAM|nr:hypothetical protein BJ138DRAFT_1004450 [Hygrophoropsis aurantiaca]